MRQALLFCKKLPRTMLNMTTKPAGILCIASIMMLACANIPGCGTNHEAEQALEQGAHGVTPDADLPPEDARALWLRNTLIEDNRGLLERYPGLTDGKFLKMSSTYYNYFRGTANIFVRDLTQATSLNTKTAFGSADASHVLLVGDPHPENLGCYKTANDRMVVDFNDFDAATYGPYHFDVRRLALGFWVLGEILATLTDMEMPSRLAENVAKGYAEEIISIAAGNRPYVLDFAMGEGEAGAGAIFGDAIRRGERDGKIREELDEYTVIEDGVRKIKFGTIEESEIEGLIRDIVKEVPETKQAQLRKLIRDYPRTLARSNPLHDNPDAFTIKGVSRRLGAGVSSYPIQRYYVIIEGKTKSAEDDVLLEFKESLDGLPLSTLPAFKIRKQQSNAHRVVEAQRELQTVRDNDVWLGWVASDAFSMRIRERSKYQKGVGVARIFEDLEGGDLKKEDVLFFATQAGRLLARAHAKSKTLEGKDAGAVIAKALGKGTRGFAKETLTLVKAYAPMMRDDYQRFQDALTRHGPYLGYRFIQPLEGERRPPDEP